MIAVALLIAVLFFLFSRFLSLSSFLLIMQVFITLIECCQSSIICMPYIEILDKLTSSDSSFVVVLFLFLFLSSSSFFYNHLSPKKSMLILVFFYFLRIKTKIRSVDKTCHVIGQFPLFFSLFEEEITCRLCLIINRQCACVVSFSSSFFLEKKGR